MGTSIKYAELKCRSNFSFLRGASHPPELIERAMELGLSGLALTDLNGVYGVVRAAQVLWEKRAPKNTQSQAFDFRFICGAEIEMQESGANALPSLTFLARSKIGYGVLCQLLTLAHKDVEKGKARLLWKDVEAALTLPGAHDLIVMGYAHPALPGAEPHDWGKLKDYFGRNLYTLITKYQDGRDRPRLERAVEVSKRYAIPLVASQDVYYHVRERRTLQDVITCIREGVQIEHAGRLLFSNDDRHLKSPAEMAALFKEFPSAVTLTHEIAESCNFDLKELKYRYPTEWIPEGETAFEFLKKITWKGALDRYQNRVPANVIQQLQQEFKLVSQLQFEDYFLTVWDIVEFARSRGILCQGRGSAANSAICYCLGITAVDPVRMNLLFERFLSAERGEPPDIDVDFEHERREEVIQYIYQKYGRDRAAMVCTVVSYRSRAAIREVSKVFGHEMAKNELKFALTKQEPPPGCSIDKLEQIAALATEFHGFPRHLSIHTGGFVLSSQPIIQLVPVEPGRMEARTVIQWDKYDLDAIGFIKVDVLSLGILSAIRKTLAHIGMRMDRVPAEDPATYEMLGNADAVGVFQIESRAQLGMLARLKPKVFYDLVVEVAIVRPGPIVGKMVHPYLKRRRGLEPIQYDHPKLETILGKTLGVPLFQEQVMKMAIELAGFSPGEADQLRRAINAWRSTGSIEKIGHRLMAGLLKSGISEEFVKRIFEQIKGFASYGFPESHAASFALLTYVSSYLKCHHPAAFTASVINSQPMGFYANHTLLNDARRHGVTVLPVDPHLSEWDCTLEESPNPSSQPAIRLGFRMIKRLRREEAESILTARLARGGKFESLRDFIVFTTLKLDGLVSLALANVLEPLSGLDQRHTLWKILSLYLIKYSQMEVGGGVGQLTIFNKLDSYERVMTDYGRMGVSLEYHPMQVLRERLSHLPQVTAAELKRKSRTGERVQISGMVICRQYPSTSQNTRFATLEDETGFCDLIVRQEVFEKYEEVFLTQSFLNIQGLVQRDGDAWSIVVKEMHSITESEEEAIPVGSRDFR